MVVLGDGMMMASTTMAKAETSSNVQPHTPFLVVQSSQAYFGEWSNGRGEILAITPNTMRFNKDRRVAYKDVTRVTDGTYFEIEITSPRRINFFPRFIALKIEGNQMKMVGYDSYRNMRLAQNQGLLVNWFRD
jgi:hypothetical protein